MLDNINITNAGSDDEIIYIDVASCVNISNSYFYNVLTVDPDSGSFIYLGDKSSSIIDNSNFILGNSS